MSKKEKYKIVEQYILDNQASHYRFAFSYVKNKENALDIIQESILKALRSIDSLKEISYLKTWFYRILINTAISFLKKNKREYLLEDEALHLHLPKQEDEAPHLDLYEAINHLSPMYKTIILLRYFEDMKINDIAEMLGENSNTIKTRLYAAHRKLRIEMEDDKNE